ncbi:hypothetical protein JKP88DRAFT_245163 [Tribonema minus]|uniref:Uncharacterized protein n=1 Tax=Tribonema minus TaxID=303371 RepID=A0A835YZ94_9STRA|nr:hypothetical protein JKP88DRAFT_245163 [Tribonema minus]
MELAAEREAMLLVLSDISPSSNGGVTILAYTLEAMGARLLEVTEATESDDARACAPSRSEVVGDGPRRAVLANPQLLESVLSFVGRGHRLYLVPVARSWRTAYMSVTARQQGAAWVCVTSGSAVVETPARLEMALARGADVPALVKSCDVQRAAGTSGSMEVIHRLRQLGMVVSDGVVLQVLIGATCARRTGVLYRLPALALESGEQVDHQTWTYAGICVLRSAYDEEEQKAVLIWLSQQVRPWPVWYCTCLCHTAAENGRLASLKFLMHKDCGQVLFGSLVQDLSVIDFSSPERADAPTDLCFQFVGGVHHHVTVMNRAAAGGHIKVMQWLHHEQPLPVTPQTMSVAAANGRLAALQWLHQVGCPYDIAYICKLSFQEGVARATPSQMEWLRSVGGSWSYEMVTAALYDLVGYCTSTSKEMIGWLRSEGAPWPQLSELAVAVGAEDLNAAAVLWAAQQGCPWGDWTSECCDAMSHGRYSIKTAIHDARCPCQCE